MDTLEVERANEGGGSGSSRQYNRVQSGEHGGEFASTNTAGSSRAPLSYQGTYAPRNKGGGGGSGKANLPASSKFKTLAPGQDNDPQAVAEMQQLLTALGLGNLGASGQYDLDTQHAVMEAQKRLGIKPTGKANSALVKQLLNAYDLSPCVQRSEDLDEDDIERRNPYPGQKYKHGWIPVTVSAASGGDERWNSPARQRQRIRDMEQHIEKLRREGPPPYERTPERYVSEANARFFAADGLRVGDRIPKRPERLGYESLPSGHWRDPATGRLHGESGPMGWMDDLAAAEEYLREMKDPNYWKTIGEDATVAIEHLLRQARDLRKRRGRAQRSEDPDPSDLIRSDPLCEFTVSRSEDLMFDTLRSAVAEEDAVEPVIEVVERAQLSTQDLNDLPDDAFAYIEPGGSKDAEGKTVPRSLRHFAIHDEAHVRNALARMSQSPFGDKAKAKIYKAAKRMGIGDYDTDQDMDMHKDMGMDRSHASCCPDCLEGESHVFRREFALDGIDIIRGGLGGDGRTVEAYATVFDSPTEVKDQHGHYMETIHRAAFDDVLRGGIARVKCFYNHGMGLDGRPSDMWSVPIGTPLNIRADGKGLRTVTRFNEGADGDRVLEAIRNGAITGYSFRGPIRQSNPPRIPRARDGMPLPTVTRMKLGLTEYGPTPMPYYADANILALRSRLSTLDPDKWDRLVELLSSSTPQDQEALRTITATPASGPGAEDQPKALRSASEALARKLRRARILMEPINEPEEA